MLADRAHTLGFTAGVSAEDAPPGRPASLHQCLIQSLTEKLQMQLEDAWVVGSGRRRVDGEATNHRDTNQRQQLY
jgi:hypothetical protein